MRSKVALFGGYKHEFGLLLTFDDCAVLNADLRIESRIGGENGIYVLEEFLQTKSVHIKYTYSQ